jgi:hypothetical protein
VSTMAIETPVVLPAQAPSTAAAPAATAVAGEFRRLLDSLEELVAEHKRLAPAQTTDQLADAMRTADAGFVTAMDLRRQLEQAFRAHLP